MMVVRRERCLLIRPADNYRVCLVVLTRLESESLQYLENCCPTASALSFKSETDFLLDLVGIAVQCLTMAKFYQFKPYEQLIRASRAPI